MDFHEATLLTVLVIVCFSTETFTQGLPKVRGPKSLNDRIAIVGAGPSGIHMAYRLKKLGFKRVHVFEKRNRVGGKCWSYYHRGGKHEMGCGLLTNDYGTVFDLLKEFNMGNQTSLPPRTFWFNDYETGYTLDYLKRSLGTNDPREIQSVLGGAVQKYSAIYKRLFGEFEGELMPRPNASVLPELRGTFKDFLYRNGVGVLEAMFNTSYTLQGFGRLDKIAALYGLLWMTPKFTASLLGTHTNVYFLKKSFQPLWEKIVLETGIDIGFEIDILKITRNRKIRIDFMYRFMKVRRSLEFDFLILTPSMASLKDIINFEPDEERLFSKLTDITYIVSSLVDSNIGIRLASTPMDFYTYNQKSGDEYRIWISADFYSMINNISGDPYKNALTPTASDGGSWETRVYYQIGRTKPEGNKEILDLIQRQLKRHLFKDLKFHARIIKQTTWHYFSRFPPEEAEKGLHWDIFDMQGKYNTWYVGSSVCFESVKSVVEYNNSILRNFVLPTA